MTGRHRWHPIEWGLIVLCGSAAAANAWLYLRGGGPRTLLLLGLACLALAFFVVRRSRTRGDQVLDWLLGWLRPRDRGD